MAAGLDESEDRWVLPLRGSVVTGVTWDDRVRLALDPAGEISLGLGTVLTEGSLKAPDATPRTLGELGPAGTQQIISTRVLSAVGFKSGSLRVVFSNGVQVNVRSSDAAVPASVTFGDAVTWSRTESGAAVSGA